MPLTVRWILLLVMAVLLQTAVLPKFLLPAFKPDLLLVLMVYLALRAPAATALSAAYALGLLKDCLGGVYFGLHGFSFLAASLVLKSISDRLYVHSSYLFVLAVTLTSLGVITCNFLLLALFSQTNGILPTFLGTLIPQLLVNAFSASLMTLIPCFARPWEAR